MSDSLRLKLTLPALFLAAFAWVATPAVAQDDAAAEEAEATVADDTAEAAAPAGQEPAAEDAPAAAGFSFDDDDWGDADSFFSDSDSAISDLLAEPEWDGPRFALGGHYRVRWNLIANADADSETHPKSFHFIQHRLRLNPTIAVNDKITLRAQLLVGQTDRGCTGPSARLLPAPCDGIWGANGLTVLDTQMSDAFSNIRMQRFWGEVTTPVGVIRAGRQPSHWGLGMFSNSGEVDPEFGDAQFGDTYDRIAFATKPLGPDSDFITALIYDLISEGQTPTGQQSLLYDGDDIHEGVLVLLYQTAPLDLGVYQVARYQRNPRNYIWATDVYGRLDIGLLYGAFEMLWLYGSTRALPQLDQATLELVENEKVWVDSWIWAAELGLRFDWYDVKLKLGSAAGDQNGTNDGRVSSLSFKPDYGVGLIMFRHAYASLVERQLASTFARLNALINAGVVDPEAGTKLALAADLARTKGAVSNAFYLNPIARFEPFDDFEAKLGVVWAQANDGVAVLGEGVNAEYAYNLGWEIDAGVEYRVRDKFAAGFEAGVFFPGDVFDRAQTTVDVASGLEVQLPGPLRRASNAYLAQLRLTYYID